jgi:L-fuculose-phosphate aldolase
MSHAELRAAIVAAARGMNARGLNQGTAGNVSARVEDGLLITPSAVPYDELAAEDIVRLAPDGRVVEGVRRPSTEWRLHADVLAARPDVGAVVHAHPPFTTALACLRRGIPAFHYMVAAAGGDSIRCADYAMFGTAELARNAVAALEDRRACLLANHGVVALGASPAAALALATEVEALAAQYCRALQAGEPVLLSRAEMAEVLTRFRTYGD